MTCSKDPAVLSSLGINLRNTFDITHIAPFSQNVPRSPGWSGTDVNFENLLFVYILNLRT